MADAGRILIMPKGTYDASTTYELLDIVRHNDIVWLAKKESIGIEPSDDNSEYWFKMVEGNPLADNLETVDNGYALDAKQGKVLSDMIAEIINGTVTVEKATNAENADSLGGETAEEWQGKIDEKLDKSGGTVTGSLDIVTNDYRAFTHTRTREGLGTYKTEIGCGSVGEGAYQSVTIAVGNEDMTDTYARLDIAKNGLFYSPDDGTQHEVFHKGNKPKGTYTGNGSATERTIKVGSLSQAIMVRRAGSYNFVIVSPSGYFGVLNGSFVSGSSTTAKESYGDLAIATTSESFNASGATYEYQSL